MQRRASLRSPPRTSRARAAAALLLALAPAAAACAPQAEELGVEWPEVPASYYALGEEPIRPPGELTAEIMRSADAVAEALGRAGAPDEATASP